MFFGLAQAAAALTIQTAGLTPSQRDDLACLSLSKAPIAESRPMRRMERFFLRRLQSSDAKRDWLAAVPDPSGLTYGEFMGLLDECQERMTAAKAGG